MPEFLKLVPPTDARNELLNHLPARKIEIEDLEIFEALGRVTACTVMADEPLPAFQRSTVDGYALRASESHGASDSLPAFFKIAGEVPMGDRPGFSLGRGEAALIHTGGMLPEGADAVVMIETTQMARPGEVEVMRSVAAGENTLQVGEDVMPGDIVLAPGTRIGPAQVGGLLALGKRRVPVVRKPRVGIISSGDEVVTPEEHPRPGQVRDINSYSLAALVHEHGAEAKVYGIVPDLPEALEARLRQALVEMDAVIITAGSSASTRDFTATVIDRMGKPGVLVHGVATKPGKPTILAVCDGKPVIGLPGNPVSALSIARLFVVPVVRYLLGMEALPFPAAIRAVLTANIPSQAGREDYVPVKLFQSGASYLAEPIFFKSNLIFTLAKSDGLVQIAADATGLAAGETVDVIPL